MILIIRLSVCVTIHEFHVMKEAPRLFLSVFVSSDVTSLTFDLSVPSKEKRVSLSHFSSLMNRNSFLLSSQELEFCLSHYGRFFSD